MRKNKEIKIPYIEDVDIPAERGSNIGTRGVSAFQQSKKWRIGSGDRTIRADVEQGFWIGNEQFNNAPFRVDMKGNVVGTSATFNQYFHLVNNTLDDISDGSSFKKVTGVNTSNQITETSIADDSISTPKLQANSVTANEINVSQLSAISADLGAITAGTITLPDSGWIKGGQTGYDTGTGFFLGYDTDAYKFSIGDSDENKLTWDGSELFVKGNIAWIEVVASDDLRHSNDTLKSTTSTTPVKLKEIKMNNDLPAMRIKFDIRRNTTSSSCGGNVYGQIYKNGQAWGTQQSWANLDWTTFSEDFTDIKKNDLIQLYAWSEYGSSDTCDDIAEVQNFRIYYTRQFKYDETFTNQDP